MTKGEFINKYNIATHLANTAYSKLGLICKRFTKAYADEYGDLQDELYFIRAGYAEKEGEKLKKDQQGQLIMTMTSEQEKKLSSEIKEFNKQELPFGVDKFTPVKLEGKLLFMSATIYEELNGLVFDCEEDVYIEALEEEIKRQDSVNINT